MNRRPGRVVFGVVAGGPQTHGIEPSPLPVRKAAPDGPHRRRPARLSRMRQAAVRGFPEGNGIDGKGAVALGAGPVSLHHGTFLDETIWTQLFRGYRALLATSASVGE